MATKRLMTEKLGKDGGEGNVVVRKIGPLDGFERGVAEEFSSVDNEGVQWLGKGGELESRLRGNQPHALIGIQF
jgi:hypothetical protein